MNIIKYNNKEYIQDGEGYIVNVEEIINRMKPEINTRHNEADHNGYCGLCNTAYRASEIKEGNRCPFCYKVIV